MHHLKINHVANVSMPIQLKPISKKYLQSTAVKMIANMIGKSAKGQNQFQMVTMVKGLHLHFLVIFRLKGLFQSFYSLYRYGEFEFETLKGEPTEIMTEKEE